MAVNGIMHNNHQGDGVFHQGISAFLELASASSIAISGRIWLSPGVADGSKLGDLVGALGKAEGEVMEKGRLGKARHFVPC